MSWARFDDQYTDNPKIREAGIMAELLDMRAIIYCARHETDGLITPGALKWIGQGIPTVLKHAQRLVEIGRWTGTPKGGFYVHDFLVYNPSKAQKTAERNRGRERVANYRARNAGGNALQDRVSHRGREVLEEQSENLENVPKTEPPWKKLGMSRAEWNDAGCPEPPRLRAVGASDV